MKYPYLNEKFLEAMNEIGAYGYEKYGNDSFQAQAARGQIERLKPRQESTVIGEHAKEHVNMYLRGELHDKFGTLEHQLAAVAFNVMMEFYFLLEERRAAAA